MTLRSYIAFLLFGTAACWAAFSLVIANLDPGAGSWLVFTAFYVTLFLALLGTFSLLGMGIRLTLLRHESALTQVVIAFRQAFSFSFLVVAALFLQGEGLLQWWNVAMLIASLTFIEWAILLRERRIPMV